MGSFRESVEGGLSNLGDVLHICTTRDTSFGNTLFLFRQFREGIPSQLTLHRQLSNSVPPPTTESSILLPSPRQGEYTRSSTEINHKNPTVNHEP